MRVQRVFWRNDPKQKLRAEVEYWAHSLGSTGFGPTPAAAIKSQRHNYRTVSRRAAGSCGLATDERMVEGHVGDGVEDD